VPHILIEHSDTLLRSSSEAQNFMLAIHDCASSVGVMQSTDIKIRMMRYDNFILAGKVDSFCHLIVFLLQGRTTEQKLRLSIALRRTLETWLPSTKSVSVDIRDMDPDSYKKRLLPD
jgi:5-carboxymethyl-2-hydroxymuconate isomerase